MPTPPRLPQDADGLLKLAAQSMFDLYARTVQGMMVVDREHRIVWISEGCKSFLPALGIAGEADFVGQRVEAVVPNTLIPQVIETGRPIMVDLLTNKAGTFLVSRVPLRDDGGRVIGALGMVLMDHPESTMQPLMTKFVRLQSELESARRQLAEQRRPKTTIAAYIGSSPAALEVKRQARRVAGTGGNRPAGARRHGGRGARPSWRPRDRSAPAAQNRDHTRFPSTVGEGSASTLSGRQFCWSKVPLESARSRWAGEVRQAVGPCGLCRHVGNLWVN